MLTINVKHSLDLWDLVGFLFANHYTLQDLKNKSKVSIMGDLNSYLAYAGWNCGSLDNVEHENIEQGINILKKRFKELN